MSEFDARLERDANTLKRATGLGANPSFVLDFTASAAFFIIGILTLVATSTRDQAPPCDLPMHDYPLVGWIVAICIVIGTVVVVKVPGGHNVPIAFCVLGGIAIGTIAVLTAALPGYITLGVVLLGAVLVLATPNGGNFLLMGMAVCSLGVGIVTVWAAVMAIFGIGMGDS